MARRTVRGVRTLSFVVVAIAGLLFMQPGTVHAFRSEPTRPLVLIVHGRGYLRRDSVELRRQIVQSLRRGSADLVGDSVLTDDDVRLVWYADLLARGTRTAASGAETRCIAASGSERGDGASSVLGMIALFASELLESSGSDSANASADDLKGLAGDLRFFGNVGTRCAAESRIGDALAKAHEEARPVVLVAHSLGALVTWGHLAHRASGTSVPREQIERLVTVGSPVGSEGLRTMLLGDATKALALPAGVRSWVNVMHEDDPFAARLGGTTTSGAMQFPHGISDVSSHAVGEDPHELRGYLRDSSTVRAVLGAWCEAYARRDDVAGCRGVR